MLRKVPTLTIDSIKLNLQSIRCKNLVLLLLGIKLRKVMILSFCSHRSLSVVIAVRIQATGRFTRILAFYVELRVVEVKMLIKSSYAYDRFDKTRNKSNIKIQRKLNGMSQKN